MLDAVTSQRGRDRPAESRASVDRTFAWEIVRATRLRIHPQHVESRISAPNLDVTACILFDAVSRRAVKRTALRAAHWVRPDFGSPRGSGTVPLETCHFFGLAANSPAGSFPSRSG